LAALAFPGLFLRKDEQVVVRHFAENRHSSWTELDHMKSERLSASKLVKDEIRAEATLLNNAAENSEDLTVKSKACENCRQAGAKLKCQRCYVKLGRIVKYCNDDCQKKDWPNHKPICGKSFVQSSGVEPVAMESACVVPSSEDIQIEISRLEVLSHAPLSIQELLKELSKSKPEWKVSAKRLSRIRRRKEAEACHT